jgi:hypothetical protein
MPAGPPAARRPDGDEPGDPADDRHRAQDDGARDPLIVQPDPEGQRDHEDERRQALHSGKRAQAQGQRVQDTPMAVTRPPSSQTGRANSRVRKRSASTPAAVLGRCL